MHINYEGIVSKLFKEPLLHFGLLACALFALFGLVSNERPEHLEEIVVSPGRIQALQQSFAKVWQRPATQQELDGLIQDHIREEVLYREAMAMGLDRDDTIVRRRLRQKMEFLSEDLIQLEEPEEAVLQAYLENHADAYRLQTRFSFRQVYLKAASGDAARAETLLASLRSGHSDAGSAGDSLMVPSQFDNEPEREVARALGRQFFEALNETDTGSWQGPITSAFGLHLVHIKERVEGSLPDLAEVRPAVLRDWSSKQRKQANERFFEALLARYKVTVAEPAERDVKATAQGNGQ